MQPGHRARVRYRARTRAGRTGGARGRGTALSVRDAVRRRDAAPGHVQDQRHAGDEAVRATFDWNRGAATTAPELLSGPPRVTAKSGPNVGRRPWTGNRQACQDASMTQMDQALARLRDALVAAQAAFVKGNAEPFKALWSHGAAASAVADPARCGSCAVGSERSPGGRTRQARHGAAPSRRRAPPGSGGSRPGRARASPRSAR